MNFKVYRQKKDDLPFFDYLIEIEKKLKDINFKYHINIKRQTLIVTCSWDAIDNKIFKKHLTNNKLFSCSDLVPCTEYVYEIGNYSFGSYYFKDKEELQYHFTSQFHDVIINVPRLKQSDIGFLNYLGRGLWLNSEEDCLCIS